MAQLTKEMRDYMRAIKRADDAQLGLVRFIAPASQVVDQCEARGWVRWGGKCALGARIMFLTTKGLRAMQYQGWV